MDLLHEKIIPDPFISSNSQKVQWVENCKVAYSKKFDVDDKNLKTFADHKLVFEGIDTYSTVSLNGEELLKTENAFRKYEVKLS